MLLNENTGLRFKKAAVAPPCRQMALKAVQLRPTVHACQSQMSNQTGRGLDY